MAFFSKKTLKTGFSVHFFIRFRFRKRFRVFLYAFAFESVFPLSLSKIRFRCFCGQIKFPSKSGISFLPLFQKQTWFRSELRQDVIETTWAWFMVKDPGLWSDRSQGTVGPMRQGRPWQQWHAGPAAVHPAVWQSVLGPFPPVPARLLASIWKWSRQQPGASTHPGVNGPL